MQYKNCWNIISPKEGDKRELKKGYSKWETNNILFLESRKCENYS